MGGLDPLEEQRIETLIHELSKYSWFSLTVAKEARHADLPLQWPDIDKYCELQNLILKRDGPGSHFFQWDFHVPVLRAMGKIYPSTSTSNGYSCVIISPIYYIPVLSWLTKTFCVNDLWVIGFSCAWSCRTSAEIFHILWVRGLSTIAMSAWACSNIELLPKVNHTDVKNKV